MTNRAEILPLEDFFEALMGYEIIFVGEEHNSSIAREAELLILRALSERDPNLVLALEMFERDVQETLDAYLRGAVLEETFLELGRPWPNYEKDYRPLVELAKMKKIPVVAANIPRRVAAAVAMAGDVSSAVVGEDRIYLPSTLHSDSKEYWKRFKGAVKGMPHRGPMGRMNADVLYKAQVLKDAVMAASIEPVLNHRILFFCGHFHSDYHLGIPYQLQKNHPELKVAVVAMASSVEELPMNERSRIADFFWINE